MRVEARRVRADDGQQDSAAPRGVRRLNRSGEHHDEGADEERGKHGGETRPVTSEFRRHLAPPAGRGPSDAGRPAASTDCSDEFLGPPARCGGRYQGCTNLSIDDCCQLRPALPHKSFLPQKAGACPQPPRCYGWPSLVTLKVVLCCRQASQRCGPILSRSVLVIIMSRPLTCSAGTPVCRAMQGTHI